MVGMHDSTRYVSDEIKGVDADKPNEHNSIQLGISPLSSMNIKNRNGLAREHIA